MLMLIFPSFVVLFLQLLMSLRILVVVIVVYTASATLSRSNTMDVLTHVLLLENASNADNHHHVSLLINDSIISALHDCIQHLLDLLQYTQQLLCTF